MPSTTTLKLLRLLFVEPAPPSRASKGPVLVPGMMIAVNFDAVASRGSRLTPLAFDDTNVVKSAPSNVTKVPMLPLDGVKDKLVETPSPLSHYQL